MRSGESLAMRFCARYWQFRRATTTLALLLTAGKESETDSPPQCAVCVLHEKSTETRKFYDSVRANLQGAAAAERRAAEDNARRADRLHLLCIR